MKPTGSLPQDEQLVLELKQHHMCQDMEWDEKLMEQLLEDGLLEPESSGKIEKTKKPTAKTKLLIDHLISKGAGGHVDKLADILEATNVEKNRWLADAIWWTLTAQKNKLQVDDIIDFEAGYVVHRDYGHEKRLAEGEKRTLKRLVMESVQTQKNISQKYVQRIRHDGDIQAREADDKEHALVGMANDLEAFLHVNMPRVNTGGMKQDTGMAGLFSNLPGFEHMVREINGMVNLMTASMLGTEQLAMERDRTKDMVNISQDAEVKLHEELEGAIKKHAEELVKAQSEVVKVDKDIIAMEEELREMSWEFEQAFKRKEKILRLLQGEVDRYQAQHDKLEEEAQILRPRSKEGLEEITDWKHRKEELSKSKRINDIKKKVQGTEAKVMASMTGDQSDDDDDDVSSFLDDVHAANQPSPALSKKMRGAKVGGTRTGGASSAISSAPTSRSGSGGSKKSESKTSVSLIKRRECGMIKSRSDTALSKYSTTGTTTTTVTTAGSRRGTSLGKQVSKP